MCDQEKAQEETKIATPTSSTSNNFTIILLVIILVLMIIMAFLQGYTLGRQHEFEQTAPGYVYEYYKEPEPPVMENV